MSIVLLLRGLVLSHPKSWVFIHLKDFEGLFIQLSFERFKPHHSSQRSWPVLKWYQMMNMNHEWIWCLREVSLQVTVRRSVRTKSCKLGQTSTCRWTTHAPSYNYRCCQKWSLKSLRTFLHCKLMYVCMYYCFSCRARGSWKPAVVIHRLWLDSKVSVQEVMKVGLSWEASEFCWDHLESRNRVIQLIYQWVPYWYPCLAHKVCAISK